MQSDLVRRAVALAMSGQPDPPSGNILDSATDAADSIFAVKIGGSAVGEFWFCLSETEPFDPGDGLPVYRPSEIKALKDKGYSPDALQAIHRVKTVFDGTLSAKVRGRQPIR
jgi:hypothetical protein